MTQKIYQTIIVAIAFVVMSMVALASAPAHAQDLKESTKCGSNINLSASSGCNIKADKEKDGSGGVSNSSKIENVIKTVINILSAIVGAVSVIMIIIGGFKYVTSNGDSNSVSSAKNTIIYALVGLIIVAFAQVIVQFVLERST
jgi:Type IV secretion system pilin